MIRLGGIFSGRTVAQDAATSPALPDPPSDPAADPSADPPADARVGIDDAASLAARLREAVDHGPAATAPRRPDPAFTTTAVPVVPPVAPQDDIVRPAATLQDDPDPALTEPLTAPPSPADIDLSRIALPANGAARRAGRVRTRLLGFDAEQGIDPDPIDAVRNGAPEPTAGGFPAGWIVVIRGPGRGTTFALGNGVSQIGRGTDQAVRLDFGDISISRSNHAAIAYDDEANSFFIGHGGKANLVRLNDRPVVSTEVLQDRDIIRIGETALLFVALCRDDFRWRDGGADGTG